jgi:hypothetical protein
VGAPKFNYRLGSGDEEEFIRQFEGSWTDEQLDLVTSGFKGTGSLRSGDVESLEAIDPRTDPVIARNVLLHPASTIDPAQQPFILPLLTYLGALGMKKVPADIKALAQQYELFLIKYSLDAHPRGKERFAGLELRLNYDGGTILTHSMLPDTVLEERFAAKLRVKAALDPSLKFKPLDDMHVPGISVGGGIELAAQAGFLLQFEYRPLVAKIVALGINSSFARWVIEKPERLVGSVPFAAVVRVPRGMQSIQLTVEGSYQLERGLWWWQRETTVEFATTDPIVMQLPDPEQTGLRWQSTRSRPGAPRLINKSNARSRSADRSSETDSELQ